VPSSDSVVSEHFLVSNHFFSVACTLSDSAVPCAAFNAPGDNPNCANSLAFTFTRNFFFAADPADRDKVETVDFEASGLTESSHRLVANVCGDSQGEFRMRGCKTSLLDLVLCDFLTECGL